MLNIAEADAAIISWDSKYAYNFWRPVTAIQNADVDANPDTASDTSWTPLLVTPPFPEYTSGHSTFSGAAATVLAAFFEADDIAFTTTSGDLPGVSRSFNSFSEAATEAGLSRIYAGIHFLSANYQGLRSGERVGAYVMENFLEERERSPHEHDGDMHNTRGWPHDFVLPHHQSSAPSKGILKHGEKTRQHRPFASPGD